MSRCYNGPKIHLWFCVTSSVLIFDKGKLVFIGNVAKVKRFLETNFCFLLEPFFVKKYLV